MKNSFFKIASVLVVGSSVMSFVACGQNKSGFNSSDAAAKAYMKSLQDNDYDLLLENIPDDLSKDMENGYLSGDSMDDVIETATESQRKLEYSEKKSDISAKEASSKIKDLFSDDDAGLSDCFDKFDSDKVKSAKCTDYEISINDDTPYTTSVYTYKYNGKWYTYNAAESFLEDVLGY